ncbi:HlyD family efflux transporter periplasmic adaptor subunit [Zooshikella marina]|uniref:efflux RND transporter periplasmic adaptor subunit n=1 Tax=Zooshikella ganghwensis TaxID=202772 RepID=UPI001BB03032|nr:HlyD family efflux transporter periplasmic adaptor subunit [Zooshikella ganghwensis]MBU2707112.1 HlyD family efflux transporter periplasmic adaptor subunit [Zooshikella ganghwensis]
MDTPQAQLSKQSQRLKQNNDANNDPKFQRLLELLSLESELKLLEKEVELFFTISNETIRIIPYDQSVLFACQQTNSRKKSKVNTAQSLLAVTASSLSTVDKESPFIIWLQAALKHIADHHSLTEILEIKAGMLTDELRSEWCHWCPGHVLWCPLLGKDRQLLGGVWLIRRALWEQSDKVILMRLMEAYAYTWQVLTPKRTFKRQVKHIFAGRKKWVALTLLMMSVIPVRLSVLASAQVVARQPLLVTAPLEGVVKEIKVKPNQSVAKGDLLFTLDDTVIRNQHSLAVKAYDVAQANYMRASQQAFANMQSKAELAVLKAILAEKKAEVDYQQALMERIKIVAQHSGVVVFSDPNDWIGKPVVVGEKVMTIADIHDTWLDIWLPVDDAVNLESGAEVRLFLNIDPLNSIPAKLEQTSYEAELSPRDILAYRLKASFLAEEQLPRLGLKGVVKIYADHVPLIYYIFRRPLSEARRWFGL